MFKKKDKQNNMGNVVVPVGHPNPPLLHEIETAEVLANHFQCTVEFLVPIYDYKRKTADILMLGTEWEMKCPTGASKATIENQFRKISRQARNIVIDTRRTALEYETIEKRVLFELKNRPSMKKINRFIMIDKSKNVIEIKK
jgi:hypothetical protein